MRDKERGVVWEESIVLLPDHVIIVMLSATLPNANELAQWVVRLKRAPFHVIKTDFRPVPLRHFIYPTGAEGIFQVVDEKGKINYENFNKVDELMTSTAQNSSRKKRKSLGASSPDIIKVVHLTIENNLGPMIVFCLSKKRCEEQAVALQESDN